MPRAPRGKIINAPSLINGATWSIKKKNFNATIQPIWFDDSTGLGFFTQDKSGRSFCKFLWKENKIQPWFDQIRLAKALSDTIKALKGKLLITHGGIDENVNPSATFKLAEALIKANKEFDMLILPSQRHGYQGIYNDYFTKKKWNYFVEHLLGGVPVWEVDMR